MVERRTVSREELRDIINRDLASRPECAGIRLDSLPLRLREPDSNGCNWSQSLHFSKESNVLGNFPPAFKNVLEEMLPRWTSEYNLP